MLYKSMELTSLRWVGSTTSGQRTLTMISKFTLHVGHMMAGRKDGPIFHIHIKIKHMKLLIPLLFLASTSYCQVSAELGMSSRFSGTAKIALEVPLNVFNVGAGTLVSLDNYHPIFSLQTGVTLYVDRFNQELRLAVSGNYHSGLLALDKDERVQKFLIGGSIRFKWSCNVFSVVSFDGETARIGLGYLFQRRN